MIQCNFLYIGHKLCGIQMWFSIIFIVYIEILGSNDFRFFKGRYGRNFTTKK
uniref:Bm13423 n=1 Tax=Brugia malayi TaxID=6279 RepID=A0A0J9XSV1_BRUMA|nr:Bm13423 [Brugia malayi]